MKKTKSILATTMVASALAIQSTVSYAQSGPSANGIASTTESIRPFKKVQAN